MTSSRIVGFGLAVCLVAAPPALAETISFKAELKGSSEVPANDSKGVGAVTATYDTATKRLMWKGDYSGLSGPATMAHFHGPADPDKNAAVVVPIAPSTSPFERSATLTDAQAAELMTGKWYVNVHTAVHPGGEIRGQVVKGN